jgi:hypothetical protein
MTSFGPPAGGSREPWGGGRPDDAYGPAPAPRYESPYESPYEPAPGGWGGQGGAADPHWGEQGGTTGDPRWDDRGPAQPAAAPGYRPYQPASRAYPPGPQPGYPSDDPYRPGGPQSGHPSDDLYRPGGPAPDPYAQPAPPPKRGKGLLIGALVALLVLVLGGVAAFVLLRDDDTPPAVTPTALPTLGTDPSAEATEAAPASSAAAPQSSTDPRFVKAGQCVRNEGPAGGKPKLAISPCGAKTYQVLRRFDGPTSGEKDAQTKCAKVDGYTNWYFFDSELDTLDFVLCLKQR